MATKISITTQPKDAENAITRTLQSGNINFLLGSGASLPAIATAGNIEHDLNALIDVDEKAYRDKKLEFLKGLQRTANRLISGKEGKKERATLANYEEFLRVISRVLEERKTELLPKQVTVFTANYDLFVERAAESLLTTRLNDGFNRNPTLTGEYPFEPEHFFDVTYKTGNLFKYEYPIPVVNLVKLHGSQSWYEKEGRLVHRIAKTPIPMPSSKNYADRSKTFLSQFSLVLPTRRKFSQTLMERVYYDLLRMFSNSLEIENTVLVSFGFSFDDEHIFDIVTKALKNPTLVLFIVAHSEESVTAYEQKFRKYNNVTIFHPDDGEVIDFPRLNQVLLNVVPKSAYADG